MKCKECTVAFCLYRETNAEKECVFSFPQPSEPYSVNHTGTFPSDVDQEVSKRLSKVTDIIINQVRDAIELDGCIDPNSGELQGLDLTKLKQFCEAIGQSDVKVIIKKR